MQDNKKAYVELKHINKTFNDYKASDDVSFSVEKGKLIGLLGPSGSGKTTILRILAGLENADSGEIYIDGKQVNNIPASKREIGFVFQTYNLIARTSALKNVELPMMYAGMSKRARTAKAKELLKLVDMEERMDHTPDELSGGQKQRVAIARALGNDPAIILADEPTGALDSKTGRMVMDLFHKLHKEKGITIVLITHSNELAEETQRIITLKDGTIIGEREGSAYAV